MSKGPFTYDNLLRAARECLSGVMWKGRSIQWRNNMASWVRKLEEDIDSGRYRPSKPTTVMITSPKPRTASAQNFRDRVVDKVICHEGGLTEDLFRNAYVDNCACRKDMGTSFALKRMKLHLQRHFRRYGNGGYVIEADIHSFFASISHEAVIRHVYNRVRDPLVRSMVADKIHRYRDENGNECGLDLGSEINQNLANSVLTPLDYAVKQAFGIEGYIRYCDNFILLLPEQVQLNQLTDSGEVQVTLDGKDYAKMLLVRIKEVIHPIGLTLNPKTTVHPLKYGICFLGFRFILTETGRVIMKPLKKSWKREKRKLKRLVAKYRTGEIEKEKVWHSFRSWEAYRKQGNVTGDIKKMYDYLMGALAD